MEWTLLSIVIGRFNAAAATLALIVVFASGAGCAGNGDVVSKIATIPANDNIVPIWALDFSPDASQIAIGHNFQVDVWDWKRKRPVATIPLPVGVAPQVDANAVQFSPDGSQLAILVDGAAQRLVVRVLNTKDWTVLRDIRNEQSARVVGLAFTPDGQFLLTANDMVGRDGNSLTIYEIDTGTAAWALNPGSFRPLAIAISPNGKSVAIDGELTIGPPPETKDMMERIRQTKHKRQLHIVDLSARSITHTIECETCVGPMAWSSDSNRITVVGGAALEIYDANTGARIRHLSEPEHGHQNIRLTADGRFSIDSDAGAVRKERELQIWDANRQKLLRSLRGNIWSLAVSRDSQFLATGADDKVTIWQFR